MDWQAQNELYHKRSEQYRKMADDFLRGKVEYSDLPLGKGSSKEQNHFSVEFLHASIQRLRESKIGPIKSLMAKYDSVYDPKAIPLFKITGSLLPNYSPTNERGGFHRSTGEIFIDIERTGRREWLFILLHEIYHALDEDLFNSWNYFINDSQKRIVEKILEKKEHTKLDRHYLDLWVYHGLNSHLFAEYRDWLFFFDVYEKGRQEQLWGKVPFIELVLRQRKKGETLEAFTYRYLNERATISDKFFDDPILQQIISKQRLDFFKMMR